MFLNNLKEKKGHPTAEFMLKLKKGVNHKHPNHNFVLEVSLPKVCISTSRACYCKYSVYNKEMNHPLGTNPHTHTHTTVQWCDGSVTGHCGALTQFPIKHLQAVCREVCKQMLPSLSVTMCEESLCIQSMHVSVIVPCL